MQEFNEVLFGLIFGLSGRSAAFDWFGVFFAEYLPYALAAAFFVLLLKMRGWKQRLAFFAEGATALIAADGIIAQTIHFFYSYPRPFEALNLASLIRESGSAFPSDHAAILFALSTIVYCRNRRAGIWFFVLSSLVGIARVFAGVHWPFDILGGAAAGILGGIISHQLLGRYSKALAEKTDAAGQK